MKRLKVIKAVVLLGLGGTMFAGYLAFSKMILGTCALGEACVNILGLPSCVYGFCLFAAILAVSGYAVIAKVSETWVEKTLQVLGIVGVIFSAYVSILDIGPWLSSGASYSLVLPSCVYGLAFFIAVLVLASWLVGESSHRIGDVTEDEETVVAPLKTDKELEKNEPASLSENGNEK